MTSELGFFDLSRYIDGDHPPRGDADFTNFCGKMARSIQENGAILVMNPKCYRRDYNKFVTALESYFEKNQNLAAEHNQLFEVPVIITEEELLQIPVEYHPTIAQEAAVHSRICHSVGPRPSPEDTSFEQFNQTVETISDDGFQQTLDSWGINLLGTLEVAAQLIALGFGLPKEAFTSRMILGPHFLAPTGCDLKIFGQEGTVLSKYHYDPNFLTIQGPSRFHGHHAWIKNGRKIELMVPEGCLVIQAGKQFEWLTAGHIKAGLHEIVVSKKTTDAMMLAREQNRSLWAVSSMLFAQIASDAILEPLDCFVDSTLADQYPPIRAGEYFEQQINAVREIN